MLHQLSPGDSETPYPTQYELNLHNRNDYQQHYFGTPYNIQSIIDPKTVLMPLVFCTTRIL